MFITLFAHADKHYSATDAHGGGGDADVTRARVERVCAADFRNESVCRISDRPYDVRKYKEKMLNQMVAAFFGRDTCGGGCLYTIGYFQETIYFLPERARILGWFGLPDAVDSLRAAGRAGAATGGGGRSAAGPTPSPAGLAAPHPGGPIKAW